MAAPKLRINNYTENKNISMDILSRIFITSEFLIGLNRVNVLGIKNLLLYNLACLYSAFTTALVSYFIYYSKGYSTTKCMKLIPYGIYIVFGFTTRKKLEQFYNELRNFDTEVGSVSKITRGCLSNILQTAFIMAFTLFTIHEEDLIQFAILYLIHILENQYYGHLLHLLIQRLRLINWCVKTSLINTDMDQLTEVEKFTVDGREIKMSKLMDFYCIIVNAYDLLTNAIKCQVNLLVSSDTPQFQIHLINVTFA